MGAMASPVPSIEREKDSLSCEATVERDAMVRGFYSSEC